jgi:hypothetical protein
MSSDINESFATANNKVSDSTIGDVGNNSAITIGIVKQLQRTRPWVLFLSIIGFLITALTGLGTLGIFFGGGSALHGMSGQQMPANSALPIMGVGVIYLFMTFLYFFASLYLFRYAGSIKKVINFGGSDNLEAALKYQASFWKLVGILIVVMMVFMLIALVFGIGTAIMGGMH